MFKSIQATLTLLILLSLQAHAQEAIEISDLIKDEKELSARDISKINETIIISDTLDGWNSKWAGNINGGQAAYNNWSQGGVNTITLTASTVLDVFYRKERFGYGFSTNLKYGKARIDEEGTRKTDDRIALNNKFSYQFTNTNWNAFSNINFSTQFDQGFDYDVDEDEDPVLISEFFSPAYLTQIAGIGYTPADYFAIETGFAMKETFVLRSTLLEQYGLEAGDNFRFEPGYSVAIGFEKDIVKNLRLTSSVETFTNMQRHVDRTDVAFTNELTGEINDFLHMSFQFVSIYDEDFSRKTQFKQVLSAGFSVSIL